MSTPLTIRLFRLSDLDRILDIEQASFGEDAYDRNLFANFYHKCGDLFLVAARGRRAALTAGPQVQRPLPLLFCLFCGIFAATGVILVGA